MPKLLKSLFPVRDEKRGKPLSPLTQQPAARIPVQPALPDPGGPRMVQVPRESVGSVPMPKVCERPSKGLDGPPSPVSEASSGYFSHSVSSATLSDAPSLDAAAPTPGSPSATLCLAPEPLPPTAGGPPAAPEPPKQAMSPGTQTQGLARTSPPPPSAPADPPQKDPVVRQIGGEACPKGPAPASPFRIRKVRTSELQSFSRMLAPDLGDSSAGPPAAGKLDVSSDSEEATEVPEWLREGEYVTVGAHKTGIVRYVGPTDFQEGTWVGVELDSPSGKNDGCIGGRQYFRCRPGHGLLVRPGRVRQAGGAGRRRRAGGAPEPRRTSSPLSGSASNLASLTAALAKAEAPERAQRHPENRKSWAS